MKNIRVISSAESPAAWLAGMNADKMGRGSGKREFPRGGKQVVNGDRREPRGSRNEDARPKGRSIFIRWGFAGIAAAALIVALVAANTGAPAPASASDGRITTDHSSYDFGQLSMSAGTVTHRFELKNPSGTPVIITKIATSCMCTTAEVKNAGGTTFGRFGMPGHGSGSAADIAVGPGV